MDTSNLRLYMVMKFIVIRKRWITFDITLDIIYGYLLQYFRRHTVYVLLTKLNDGYGLRFIDGRGASCCLSVLHPRSIAIVPSRSLHTSTTRHKGAGGGGGREQVDAFVAYMYHVALFWSYEHLQCTLFNKTQIQINFSQI